MSLMTTGQMLRHLGRAIELLCLLALLSVYRGQGEFWRRRGLDPALTLTIVFGIGVIIWSVGTYLMLRARRQQG